MMKIKDSVRTAFLDLHSALDLYLQDDIMSILQHLFHRSTGSVAVAAVGGVF